MRIGYGIDVHRLTENRKLILGGLEIPYHLGLLGHSDADVLTHSICDALLGAAALGDIGTHFPDSDPKYKNISSILLLKETANRIKPYKIVNIDSTIMAQAPKLAPFIAQIREILSTALTIDIGAVSVKATTTEKLGYCGEGLGIEARSICLIEK